MFTSDGAIWCIFLGNFVLFPLYIFFFVFRETTTCTKINHGGGSGVSPRKLRKEIKLALLMKRFGGIFYILSLFPSDLSVFRGKKYRWRGKFCNVSVRWAIWCIFFGKCQYFLYIFLVFRGNTTCTKIIWIGRLRGESELHVPPWKLRKL